MTENQKSTMSPTMQRIFNKIDSAKDRASKTEYPYLPSGNHHCRVKRVVLFKNRDDITCFKLEVDVTKSTVPGVSGIHVVILSYKGPMSDARQEETKQILSAITASQRDLANDAALSALGQMDPQEPDYADYKRETSSYKFSPLVPATTAGAIEMGWLEVDFGEDDKIPSTFDLNGFDLYIYTASFDKKLWVDSKTKKNARIDEKTGQQATVVVHSWRGCSVAELRKEGILQ